MAKQNKHEAKNTFTLTICLFVSVFVFLSQSEKPQCAVIT